MPDLAGKTVGGYPIEKLLTKVSYGELYQATTSAAPLAVRLMREDLREDAALNAAVAKGWEEARKITHANLVTCFSTGVEPGLGAFCLEELVRGRLLRQIILDGAKMAWRDCLILTEQLFAALNALHSAKTLHGDIWSAAIMITQDQDLKLEGAGGLLHLDRRFTDVVQGQALGYQAPEILKGSPISAGSDIYSAGACLYFILAGHDPYPPEAADVLLQHMANKKLAQVTALRDDLPAEADEFITRLMAQDPTQRYGSAVDVLSDIGRMKDGGPLGPLKGGVAAKPPKFPSKSKSNPAAQAVSGTAGSGVTKRPSTGSSAGSGKAAHSGQQKKISGFPAAISAHSLASGTRVFGRLDTHVKSTIPQSDQERKGDDLYRQGQLPLALACWREAVEMSPHTGLKVKLELGERDLKKEAYNIAMDEARQRLHNGDYSGAIGRSHEALVSAENEQQRQDAISIEKQASVALEEELAASRKKMMIAGGVLLVLLILGGCFLFGRSAPAPEPEKQSAPPVVTPEPKPAAGSSSPTILLQSMNSEVPQYPSWRAWQAGVAAYSSANKPVVQLVTTRWTETSQSQVYKDMQEKVGKQYKDAKQVEALEFAFTVPPNYQVAKLTYSYTRPDNATGIVRIFVIDGPDHVVYLANFEGSENDFTPQFRDDAEKMIRGWKFKAKK
jgi:serine/threonine protein kinase